MPSLSRRTLFTVSAAAATTALGARSQAAQMALAPIEPRGKKGIFRRLPDLNLESYHDYLRGVRQWSNFYGLTRACEDRAREVLTERGHDPNDDSQLSLPVILSLAEKDPIITLYGRAWLDGQYYKFLTLRDAFHADADKYLSELDANDQVGLGTLELNPAMFIPDYTKHEIHTQLGGYVGDPLAGYIYLYDTLILNDGANEQDAGFMSQANALPAPPDGKIRRILDNGTGVGQLATSMQKRFPEAEVWGIDVGGPMVRYAHMRANDIGSKVNFAQRLAEDNKFPDNHFDMITSSAFHHEVTGESSTKIYREAMRTLRPGGVFVPTDNFNGPLKGRFGMLREYLNYRWNHEDWQMEWVLSDAINKAKSVGFKVEHNPQTGRIMALKA